MSDSLPPSAPTGRQTEAYRLRVQDGLNDEQIGEVMGITRESANRLIAAYLRAANAIRDYCRRKNSYGLLQLLKL